MTSDRGSAALNHLRSLAATPIQKEWAQVYARAVLANLPGQPPEINWTYDVDRVLRNATAALIDVESVIDDDHQLATVARQLGQLWESLARLSSGRGRQVALTNAMLAYELAQYQANSACIARELAASDASLESDPFLALVAHFFRRQLFQTNRLEAVMHLLDWMHGSFRPPQTLSIRRLR